MKTRSFEPTITMMIAGIGYMGFHLLGQAVDQVTPSTIPDIGQIIANLGVVGTLVWYLYHNTTKTIPDLTDKYTRSIDEINNRSISAIAEERVRSNEMLEKEHQYRQAEVDQLCFLIRAEATCHYQDPRHPQIELPETFPPKKPGE